MLHTLRTSQPRFAQANGSPRGRAQAPCGWPLLARLVPWAAALGLMGASSCSGGPAFDLEAPPERELRLQDRMEAQNGAIVSVVGVSVTEPWENLGPSTQARFDEDAWNSARADIEGRADLVTYSSDSLRIGSFLVRPKSIEGRRLGAVIVNRDGIANLGLDENELLVELNRYAERGYVAAASAYRGNRLSQGVDELGGDDVGDVLALVTLLQRLDYVDPQRIFMVGFGRGGLMTYRALEMGAPVRAAAVISGIADLREVSALDSEIEQGFGDRGGWPGLAKIHGDWSEAAKEAQLKRRTPRERADELDVPILLVHGRLDDEVPASQALSVATRLRRAGTPVEAMIYGYGDHALLEQRKEWQARVMDWIDRHDSRALFN